MKKAVVLLSGGLDSTTTLALARSEGYEVYALSFDYGQRHNIELELAQMNAEKYGAKKHFLINTNLNEMGGSALTADIEVPKNSAGAGKRASTEVKENVTEKESIPVTYVPARNTIFLSFALAWAETLGAEVIFIGANAVDYSGYPDCRPEYIKAFQDMANLATKASVEGKVSFEIHTPLIKLTKAEIIKKGLELGVDYSLTWSCYDPEAEHKPENSEQKLYSPCMKCDSCLFRAKGFLEAGIKDPLAVKD